MTITTDRTRPRVLVLAGRGRYEDPWHDHAATSHRIAQILSDAGFVTAVRSVMPERFDALRTFDELTGFDLVVVNSGRGRIDPAFDDGDETWAPLHEKVRDYLAGGGAVLGVHQAANTFADSPYWRGLLGGAWVPGTSHHPPKDEGQYDLAAAHPITDGLPPLTAFDERYCDLQLEPGSTVLVTQRHEGVDHPVVWVSAAARAAYDALGHDLDSYDSPSRVGLLVREAEWLVGRL